MDSFIAGIVVVPCGGHRSILRPPAPDVKRADSGSQDRVGDSELRG